uniref:Probable disease resistance RPP8-like protein 2 n=2 Tax=Elaeis guineensis var. tenera TaxID=51953 RepID=A0A6J0PDT7_ELAGV|nr:probable disease resistance RPP8-like protein 2 [Elaeis guineensis]
MLQVVQRSMARGWVKSIRIHDMLRDVGLSEVRKDGFLHVCSGDDVAVSNDDKSHRAAFHNRINDEVAVSSPHLRTLMGFNLVLKGGTAAGRFLKGLNLLRVLDLEGAKDLEELPKQIGNMIHLRYLGLRNTDLKRLPSSIGRLLNLLTLDVRDTQILWLPKSLWKIRTLRHVYINFLMFPSAPISGDHKNLQTLKITYIQGYAHVMHIICLLGSKFIKNWVTSPGFTKEAISDTYERMLRKSFEKSFGKSLEKMGSFIFLTLSVHGPIPGNVLFAQAPNLHHLRSLNLNGQLLLEQQQLPDSTRFPPNLTKLILTKCRLERDPMPVLEKLPNLMLLRLGWDAYLGTSMSCSSRGFPRLQHLMLDFLAYLEEWTVQNGAMPGLTHLTIDACGNLKMLPEGLQHVTTLRELKLMFMPADFVDKIRNEDRYKVQHISSVIFQYKR